MYNGTGNWDSVPVRVIPNKDSRMVLDAALLNTQHYKVKIKGKVEQSKKRSSALPYVVAIEKEAFELPLTMVANFTCYCLES